MLYLFFLSILNAIFIYGFKCTQTHMLKAECYMPSYAYLGKGLQGQLLLDAFRVLCKDKTANGSDSELFAILLT